VGGPFLPGNQTKLGRVGIENVKGSQVPIKATTDLLHLASFISSDVVDKLGLEERMYRYPPPGKQIEPTGAIVIGSIPLFLANFTQEQLKIKDEFYVVDIPDDADEGDEAVGLPGLFIGLELLRQISGLAVNPAVIG